VRYLGRIPHSELHARYAGADLCLFASTCENMPNILLEGMASGLPIACSDRGPMPEVLGDAGVYFDPEKPDEIARALRELIESPELRTKLAQSSFERVRRYSWRRCADETFKFLAEVARSFHNKGSQPSRP
jgi:glycosyltransferase involved in cell wall biosynthesis